MSETDWNLREILEAATGEPPHRVTAAAARSRAARRRAGQTAAACLAAILIAGAGAVSAAAIHAPWPAADRTLPHASLPRYYVAEEFSHGAPDGTALVVRATATGRVTAVIGDPRPSTHCQTMAAADGQAFFLACAKERWSGGRIASIETLLYRFRVTSSGRVAGPWPVRGGVLKGLWTDKIAVTPDGSEVALEVIRPQPGHVWYSNTAPEGIMVLNTRTGHTALWRAVYRPGAVQFAWSMDLSFTRDGRTLVVNEARCHRGSHKIYCDGSSDTQVRAYQPAAAGGSLDGGRTLVRQSALTPRGTVLNDAFISPDGSTVTAVLTSPPGHAWRTLRIVRMSAATGRVLRVLYQVRNSTANGGMFYRFFSWDPSGRYLILDASAGRARVNGWIDHGRLVRLAPANGNMPEYETW